MKQTNKDTRWTVTVALMMAVVILLANTPLGLIQLPIIKATTVHIPVIIGAIVLGPLAGAILGATFGICSMIINTVTPSLLSFAFSPFLSTTGISGVLKAVWIAVGCRVLLGILAGWIWILFKKIRMHQNLAFVVCGFLSSILHTIIVMGSIYVLLAAEYASAREVEADAVFGLILGTVTAAGIPEAIAAAVLVTAIGKILQKIYAAGRREEG